MRSSDYAVLQSIDLGTGLTRFSQFSANSAFLTVGSNLITVVADNPASKLVQPN